MLSAVIPSGLRYPALTLGRITGKPEVRPLRSSRTKSSSSQRADIEVPNFPVDVNSWGKSACYPRSTFCPLSDGLSTQHHQITKTYFRTCSNCHSRSQASLCLYTRAPISNRSEETFAHLRYSLGGDRPSQTACLTLSPILLQG